MPLIHNLQGHIILQCLDELQYESWDASPWDWHPSMYSCTDLGTTMPGPCHRDLAFLCPKTPLIGPMSNNWTLSNDSGVSCPGVHNGDRHCLLQYTRMSNTHLPLITDPCLTDHKATPDDLIIPNRDREGKGPLYELSKSPGKGQGLFATEFIQKGTQILQEKPVLTCPALDSHLGSKNNPIFLLNFVAQIFNLAPCLQQGLFSLRGEQVAVPSPSMRYYRAVLDQFLHADGSKLSLRECLRLQDAVRIFFTNAAAMYEGSSTWWFWRPKELGDGLFLTFSRMNHSCEPNALWDTDLNGRSGVMSVWAEKDIQPGEEITISYIPLTVVNKPREKRRQILRRWGFDCQCTKCGSLVEYKYPNGDKS